MSYAKEYKENRNKLDDVVYWVRQLYILEGWKIPFGQREKVGYLLDNLEVASNLLNDLTEEAKNE